VVEWPGGEPKTFKLEVPESVLKSVLRGGNRIPLNALSRKNIHKFAALPWGSRVGLHSEDADVAIVSGPAQLATHWYLTVIGPTRSKKTDTIESLKKEALRLRKSLGYMPI
jgi:hypothetical protein